MSAPRSRDWSCPPATVLAAVDFSDASARAAAVGGLVASAFASTYRALHAERLEPPPYFTVEQIDRLEAGRRDARASATRHLSEFVGGVTEYPADAVVADAPPVDAILHAASEADLTVMGTHRRSAPARWWLGSVAERVVRAAAVPVLVTRGGAGAVTDVFEHLVVVADLGAPPDRAQACAEVLATTFGGRLTLAGPLQGCSPEVMRQASLVVVATSHERPAWGLSDLVARTLGDCERPVLFVPSR